jgi:signal transduction histidine kinase
MTRLLPRHWSIKSRLTILYGSLFFAAGTILLLVNYFLVWQTLNTKTLPGPDISALRLATGISKQSQLPSLQLPDGRELRLDELVDGVRKAQQELRDNVLDSLMIEGIVSLVGVGLIAGALGWVLARRALQPVHRITETAQRIAGSQARGLHERLALSGPDDEVAQLARTFNTMIERLDRSFDGQRRFVANASHEMRTPLAVKRALIEVTTSRAGTSADARQLGEALLEVNARHERLIDGLLLLADSENELTERSRIDLADVAGAVLDQLSPAAQDAGVRFLDPDLAAAPVLGDPVLLERTVQNLVENAIRHNRTDGWLSVATREEQGASIVVVRNTGPVIQPYEIDTLFQPFRRLDRERTSGERGFGLGLSIVLAVCTAHGGDVSAVPRRDGGLDVTVRLPTGTVVRSRTRPQITDGATEARTTAD